VLGGRMDKSIGSEVCKRGRGVVRVYQGECGAREEGATRCVGREDDGGGG